MKKILLFLCLFGAVVQGRVASALEREKEHEIIAAGMKKRSISLVKGAGNVIIAAAFLAPFVKETFNVLVSNESSNNIGMLDILVRGVVCIFANYMWRSVWEDNNSSSLVRIECNTPAVTPSAPTVVTKLA